MRTENGRLKTKRNVFITLLSLFMMVTIFISPVLSQTTEDQVEILERVVDNLSLHRFVDHLLLKKLDKVQESIENGNYKHAVLNMHAFKMEVCIILKISEKTKKNFLTKEQADILLGQADMIIGSIRDTTVATVGPAGGSILVNDSSQLLIAGSSVTFPLGSIASDTVITIVQDNASPDIPSNFSVAGPAVDFGPSGLTFLEPVTISVPYYQQSDVQKIRLLSFVNDQWTEIPINEIDTIKKIIFAQVSHFSTYQAAESTDIEGAPVFNWINLWNINSSGNNVIAMGCSITDPDGEHSFMPNNISDLRVEAPDGSSYYNFIEGDWTIQSVTNNGYYWRWIRLSTDPEPPYFPPNGDYKFVVTDINGNTTEQIKTLIIDQNRIPVVDDTKVQISRDGINWISQVDTGNGGFEKVALTGQSLWIKWDSVDNLTANPPKVYYYRVQIRSRTQDVLHNSKLIDGYGIDRVEIPIEVLNNILHDRSFYRFRIEVLDTGHGSTASNKSESKMIPLTTGDLSLSDPVIDWAVVYKNSFYSGTELREQLQCNFSLLDPDGFPDIAKVTAVNVTVPMKGGGFRTFTESDYSWSPNVAGNKLSFFLTNSPSLLSEYSTGRVIFQITYDGKDYFFEDFFNFMRSIIPPETTFGGNDYASRLLVSKPITLIWNATLSAKTYEGRIDEFIPDEFNPNEGTWNTVMFTPWITPVLQPADIEVSYAIPDNAPISSGKIYRWHVRAYDETNYGDIDGRGSSRHKFFEIQ